MHPTSSSLRKFRRSAPTAAAKEAQPAFEPLDFANRRRRKKARERRRPGRSTPGAQLDIKV